MVGQLRLVSEGDGVPDRRTAGRVRQPRPALQQRLPVRGQRGQPVEHAPRHGVNRHAVVRPRRFDQPDRGLAHMLEVDAGASAQIEQDGQVERRFLRVHDPNVLRFAVFLDEEIPRPEPRQRAAFAIADGDAQAYHANLRREERVVGGHLARPRRTAGAANRPGAAASAAPLCHEPSDHGFPVGMRLHGPGAGQFPVAQRQGGRRVQLRLDSAVGQILRAEVVGQFPDPEAGMDRERDHGDLGPFRQVESRRSAGRLDVQLRRP